MFRTVIIVTIIAVLSFGIVYLFNSGEVSRVNSANIVITPDTFAGTSEIELGRVVEIVGTPDLLNSISLEERNNAKVISYYAPLQEYDTNFVVKIDRKSKLRSEQQTFIGEVTGINKSEFGKRIKTVLNKPVELSEDDRAELDPETIELLVEDTTKEFPNKALLILDEQVPDHAQLFYLLAFWTAILTLIISTIFRRFVFRDVFFKRR